MPGLFGAMDDDVKLGLLTAALAAMSARGVKPGTALARGGLLGLGAVQNARAGRADERRQKMQEELWQSQMAENLAQSEERRAKIAQAQEAAQRQAKISAGAPRVGVPEFNTGTPGYSSGVSQAYGVPEAKPADTKVDVYAQLAKKAAYLADNNDIDTAVKYVDMANKMKPKYSPTLSVVLDPATNKHILVQASETEMPRPVQGMAPERKVELKDFGGSLGAVDMRDLMPGASFPKTMTPDGRDSSARGWATINDARAKEKAATAPNLTDPKAFDQENKLRDEYVKGSQEFILARDAYSRIQSAAKSPSAAGDIALVFNYMKMLDPKSTVREGEYATAANAGSVPAQIIAKYNAALSGKFLADDVRNDFVNRAGMLYGSYQNAQKKHAKTYSTLASQYKLKPENVALDLESDAPSGGGKQVKRTGTMKDGRRVVEYTDGTREVQ